jgi:hypothetical protein
VFAASIVWLLVVVTTTLLLPLLLRLVADQAAFSRGLRYTAVNV